MRRRATDVHVSWPWLTVGVAGLLFAVVLAMYVPQMLVLLLLPACVWLLVERAQTHAALAALAARIAAGELINKLEVRTGAWGALCHAVNGLLQQQRLQQHIRALLPDPPPGTLDHLLQGVLAQGEMTYGATVLLVGCTGTSSTSLASWQLLAGVARQQTERHNALMQGSGGTLLLVFGTFERLGSVAGLHAALETARALRAAWNTRPEADYCTLALSIASGPVTASVLPGLGYSVLGTPVEQAQRLQHLAATRTEFALLCAEETYVALRYLQRDLRRAAGMGALAEERDPSWVQTDMRLAQPGRPPQVVYGRATLGELVKYEMLEA